MTLSLKISWTRRWSFWGAPEPEQSVFTKSEKLRLDPNTAHSQLSVENAYYRLKNGKCFEHENADPVKVAPWQRAAAIIVLRNVRKTNE